MKTKVYVAVSLCLLGASIYSGWGAGSFTGNEWAIIFWLMSNNVSNATKIKK